MVDLQLTGYVTITGLLRSKSGIRIGGSREELEIGGVDSPILRDPADKLPYIPGSSIKGKLRSLLEYKYKRVGWGWRPNRDTRLRELTQREGDGDPCGCGQLLDKCPVCTIFGPHRNTNHSLGPSRIIVRDALVNEKSRGLLEETAAGDSSNLSEIKTENTINRSTNVAGSPRQMERTLRTLDFDLNISLRIFKSDNPVQMASYVKEALDTLPNDYLGGSGTRGYGWVEVVDLKFDGLKWEDWSKQPK